MKIKEESLNDVMVLKLEGEININNSPELRKELDELMKKGRNKVVMNFSSVSYIDSSGLATLIEVFQRLTKSGGKLRFSDIDQKVRNIFEVTKLNKLFNIFDTQELALKDF